MNKNFINKAVSFLKKYYLIIYLCLFVLSYITVWVFLRQLSFYEYTDSIVESNFSILLFILPVTLLAIALSFYTPAICANVIQLALKNKTTIDRCYLKYRFLYKSTFKLTHILSKISYIKEFIHVLRKNVMCSYSILLFNYVILLLIIVLFKHISDVSLQILILLFSISFITFLILFTSNFRFIYYLFMSIFAEVFVVLYINSNYIELAFTSCAITIIFFLNAFVLYLYKNMHKDFGNNERNALLLTISIYTLYAVSYFSQSIPNNLNAIILKVARVANYEKKFSYYSLPATIRTKFECINYSDTNLQCQDLDVYVYFKAGDYYYIMDQNNYVILKKHTYPLNKTHNYQLTLYKIIDKDGTYRLADTILINTK